MAVEADAFAFASPPRPFSVSFPAREVEDLRRRLKSARFPEADLHEDHGVNESTVDLYATSGPTLAWMKKMTKHWAEEYDWASEERRLNKYPQFKVGIDGLDVHFVHKRSSDAQAIPLILVHGWPGSFAEFLGCVDALTSPSPGGQAFHVVIPSHPGFTFTTAPRTKDWNMDRTAELFDKLMQGLGYGGGYAAQGGDWGAVTVRCLAAMFPKRCKAVHLNFCPALAPGLMKYVPPTTAIVKMMPRFMISDLERERLLRSTRYLEKGSGYYVIQATTPATPAYGMTDSPVGTLAWIGEKYASWLTEGTGLTNDMVLTTCTLYYLTNTLGTSMLPYRDNIHYAQFLMQSRYYINVPMAISVFPEEICISPKAWVARTGRLKWYREHHRGGHFVAIEYPDEFSEHVRDAFTDIWTRS